MVELIHQTHMEHVVHGHIIRVIMIKELMIAQRSWDTE